MADCEDGPDEMDQHLARFEALKARPFDTLSDDDRIWLRLFETGPKLRAARRMGLAR